MLLQGEPATLADMMSQRAKSIDRMPAALTRWQRLGCALRIAAGLPLFFMLMLAPAPVAAGSHPTASNCTYWPQWQAFTSRFVQQDGRVIDFKFNDGVSTSEGQAYALFFALVANDRTQFARLLEWTDLHLADGALGSQLPAWHWGRKAVDDWGVLDTTPAADADMWLAYALLEAARLWQLPSYRVLGLQLLDRIEQLEIATLPGFGPLVLPGPHWFALSGQRWRINPSYLPVMLLRAFEVVHPDGPWRTIAGNTASLLQRVSPRGFAPDWTIYQANLGWRPDPEKGSAGSYDAIRTYLWTGMLHPADPARPALLRAASGMRRLLRQPGAMPPERIDTQSVDNRSFENRRYAGPVGFSAAMLPYLAASGEQTALRAQQRRLASAGDSAKQPLEYYDQVLMLFGQGWINRRFAFSSSGALQPGWADNSPQAQQVAACR